MDSISFERPSTEGLVSVIMPTRRGEKYIGATLETIGRQSYQNWELIVVEDGSTGPTKSIVEQFAQRHPNNRVDYTRSDKNYGASHSRNIAFSKAAGQYLALLDSDDRWFPDHLTSCVEALRATGKDIVYSSVVMVEDGSDYVLGTWGPHVNELRDFPQSLFARSFVTPSASVMLRQVIADVGPWDTYLKYCEDFAFWLRCVGAGKQFHYLGGVHCLYRKNHSGATTTKLSGTLEEVAEVTEQYMNMPGMRAKSLRRYASKAYALAARVHASSDPERDPSADRSRTPGLLLKAWRLRPTHVDYLYKGLALSLRERLRRKTPAGSPPGALEETSVRSAA